MSKTFTLSGLFRTISSVLVNGSALGVTYTVDTKNNQVTITSPLVSSDEVSVTYTYQAVTTPLARTEFVVYKGGVELTDVDLSLIQISTSIDGQNTVNFTLNRKYDSINYTLDGSASQIDNKPVIEIKLNNRIVFYGWITQIQGDSNTEVVKITCTGPKPAYAS